MSEILKKLDNQPSGTYVGETTLNRKEMEDALEGVDRILGHVQYDKVEINGDEVQCKKFIRDVHNVATLLKKLTAAIAEGKRLDSGVN